MAYTIQDLHNKLDQYLSKEKTGYLTPAEKDTLLDDAQMWVFNKYLEVYGSSVEAQQALAPFKTSESFTASGGGAYTIVHASYVKLDGGYVIVSSKNYGITFLNEDQYAEASRSQVNAPSSTNVIAYQSGAKALQFYPESAHTGKLFILRRPVKPVFGYSVVGRVITYSSGTSTQLEWNEMFVNKILWSALALAGVPMKESDLLNAGMTLPQSNV